MSSKVLKPAAVVVAVRPETLRRKSARLDVLVHRQRLNANPEGVVEALVSVLSDQLVDGPVNELPEWRGGNDYGAADGGMCSATRSAAAAPWRAL